MRRTVAFVLTLILALAGPAPLALAGDEAAIALGLASFAVFNQLFGALFYPHVYHPPYAVGYHSPAYGVTYYRAYPRAYSPPYPTAYAARPQQPVVAHTPTVVHYPHGRYELRGDGVTTPYYWLWVPNPPPPPAAAPAAPQGPAYQDR